MSDPEQENLEERVLILAPTPRDADICRAIFSDEKIPSLLCKDMKEVCQEISQGGGAALLTQEPILADKSRGLFQILERQPTWSDFPLVVLTPPGADSQRAGKELDSIGHMTLLKRPITVQSLRSTIRSALRDRRRQYAARDYLLVLAQQELALKEADRRKNEFLAMLAHELRNPLAAIRNAVEGAVRSQKDEDTAWSLDVIGRQVQNFSHLIDDLLDVSRITQGKIRLRRRPIDCVPVVHHAAESVRPLIDRWNHDLTLSFSAPELWANADPIRLEQILTNLLTNAAKYTQRGGKVSVTVEAENAEIVCRVRDNGMGIAPESLANMFELFAQSERSLARSEGGLGIGLTLVKSLVEMHGGSIIAISKGVGFGSEFEVRLPAAEKPTVDLNQGSTQAFSTSRKGRRILVVDDNADSARGMARLLKLAGHVSNVAYDGPAAVETAREFRPEALILDIGLPGFDGYEVAQRIRREEWGRDVLIVAVSGYGQDSDRARSLVSRIDHHLTKPVQFDDLSRILEGHLNL